MTVTMNGEPRELSDGATLRQVLDAYSPYGGEPVIALINGRRAAPDGDPALHDGDTVMIYPLLIGG